MKYFFFFFGALALGYGAVSFLYPVKLQDANIYGAETSVIMILSGIGLIGIATILDRLQEIKKPNKE